jgi:NADPH-dependent glutamate synthase beta subunit-like oxidoreductase
MPILKEHGAKRRLKPQETIQFHGLFQAIIDSEKLRYCFECGKCTATCPIVELFPESYNPRILLHNISLNPEKIMSNKELWLCAWCYRCAKHCPQGLAIPEIFLKARHVAKEQGFLDGFQEAMETIKDEIAFPSTFCWVCFHPERTKIDNPTITKLLKPYLTSKENRLQPKTRKEKVAIIGSGPAGLTAAYELAKEGYPVTVFESYSQPGGMLRTCIPTYRLPREILDADINRLKQIGIEIKTNTKVGKDTTPNSLFKQGYKAVFIATGAHKTRKLHVEGEDYEGVYDALSFLSEANCGKRMKLGKVAVVGGGNTAIDAARTAVLNGAKEVTILYRRSREEMPANPIEIKEAEEEGVRFQFLVAPKKILGKDKRVTGIESSRMELGEPDETGRRKPLPIANSEFTIDLDTVILAIGESPDLACVPTDVETTEEGTIAVDPMTMETSKKGVFSGGDCVSGPATVVEAIVAGKKAAKSIHNYLKTKPKKKEAKSN